jgi:hypothetical protein
MALPVPRRVIFGAKLLALALFALLFTLSAHLALLPLSLVMSIGRFAGVPWYVQFTAYLVASLLASAFAVLAVTAVQGLLILAAPRGRLLTLSAAVRSVMLCVLVLALPLILRLPGQAPRFSAGSAWLYAAPPVWFLAIERWLLADVSRAYFAPLARIAGAAVLAATALTVGSYVFLYRRFDRVLMRPVQGSAAGGDRARRRWARPGRSRPVFDAIRTFTAITLRRSVLHQGVLVALSSVGAGLVLNVLIVARGRGLAAAMIWAPFPLMFVASLAVRLALALPIEPRANWVFRMTEHDGARIEQLDAAVRSVRSVGVIAPLILLAPLEWLVVGRAAAGVLAVALLCGWFLVEVLMRSWARIPFTCSYVPGKGFLPQTILTGFASFVLFTTIGAGLAASSFSGRALPLIADAMLVAGIVMLRRRRLKAWQDTPLAFEDQLPQEVSPLRLSMD